MRPKPRRAIRNSYPPQSLTLEQELTLDRELARAQGRALYYDCELAHALDHVSTLAKARTLACDLTYVRARVLLYTLDLAQARNLADARNLDFRALIHSLVNAMQANELHEAVGLSRTLESDSDAYSARWGRLFGRSLAIAGAESLLATRQAYRKYIIILLEYIYLGFKSSEKLGERRWRRHKASDELPDSQQALLELYWWLQMVQAREEGKLPAWEGIRIVREQAPPAKPAN